MSILKGCKPLHALYAIMRDLIYPSFCLHCQEPLSPKQNTLCSHCLSEVILLQTKGRCYLCFCALDERCSTKQTCRTCMQRGSLFYRKAAAFYYDGPASTLVQTMKYHRRPDLAKVLGAHLAIQMIALQWNEIDVIVPVPQSFLRYMERGYNQSLLLAQTISKILSIPVEDILTKKQGGYPQAALSQTQRMQLGAQADIAVKKSWDGTSKNILLIDDVTTTGTTLNHCAEILSELNPKKIYALTVCQTSE